MKKVKVLIAKIIITGMFISLILGSCYLAEFTSNLILKMLGE